MKKAIATIVLGSSLVTGSVAFASSVELQGDASVRYVHEKATEDQSGTVYSVTVKAEAPLGGAWSAYARLGAQHTNQNQVGSDFNTDYYAGKQSVVALDQFGLIFKDDHFVYKLGRQSATIGATALMYSRSDSNIGKKAFVDGIGIIGTSGNTQLTALFAREDNSENKNKVYAIRGEYPLSNSWKGGVTFGRFNGFGEPSTSHWAVDSTYKFGKQNVTAEYSQSNRSSDNKAFAVVWGYEMNDKISLSLTGFRVEANGDMGGQTDFSNNHNGIHYGLTHVLSNNSNIELVYKDEKNLISREKTTTLELTWNSTL